MQERRSCTRWQTNRSAEVKLEGALAYAHCVVNDINFKGMRISLKQHLTLDKFLKMTIMFSEGFCFDVEVWIVWHKRVMETEMYGFYFSRIKDSDKEKIYQFIRRYFAKQMAKQWWKGVNEEEGGEEMHSEATEDKRIFARFGVNYTSTFLDLDSNKEGQATAKDISAKGIGLETEEALLPETSLEMWLNLPDKGRPFYTRGKVAWSKVIGPRKFRAGVELERADLMGVSRVLRTI